MMRHMLWIRSSIPCLHCPKRQILRWKPIISHKSISTTVISYTPYSKESNQTATRLAINKSVLNEKYNIKGAGGSGHIRISEKQLILIRFCSSSPSQAISVKDFRLQNYLNYVLEKFIKAQTSLMSGKVTTEDRKQDINRTLKQLKPLVMPLQEYYGKEQEIEDLKQMANEMGKDDPEIQQAAAEEITQIQKDMIRLEQEVLFRIVPLEHVDDNNIILEVNAGVGGIEAFLFTHEIFKMYEGYAAHKGWSFNVIMEDMYTGGYGGVRKAAANVSGHDVYKNLKYEAGVHRVQRVPKTEKHGRVHTSTATVSVMPEATEIDIQINPKDLKIDTFRSSGPGGQHVNTTDSAVRIKHIPTGIVAECQSDRSQMKNKATAMKVLLSRMYQRELEAQQTELKRTRKMQIGSAGRSEKIRTYNFKQDRITDHRLSENMFDMEEFFLGTHPLDDMVQMLQFEAWKEKLMEIVTDFEHVTGSDKTKQS